MGKLPSHTTHTFLLTCKENKRQLSSDWHERTSCVFHSHLNIQPPHTLSCPATQSERSSLNESLLSASCQSSLPHLTTRCRSAVPDRPRNSLNDSSAERGTSPADKFGSIPFSLICSHCPPLRLLSCPCVSFPKPTHFCLLLYTSIVSIYLSHSVFSLGAHILSHKRCWASTCGGGTGCLPPCQRCSALVSTLWKEAASGRMEWRGSGSHCYKSKVCRLLETWNKWFQMAWVHEEGEIKTT